LTAGCEPELCEYNFTVPRRYLISTLYSDQLYNFFYINGSSASIPFYVDGTNSSNVTAWINAVQNILNQNGGGQVTATFTGGVWNISIRTTLIFHGITGTTSTSLSTATYFTPTVGCDCEEMINADIFMDFGSGTLWQDKDGNYT
jgi:hypothetical protein